MGGRASAVSKVRITAEDYESLLQLVGHAYELALDPDGWPGFASMLARTFDAGSAAVQFRDTRNKRLVSRVTTTANYDDAANLSKYPEPAHSSICKSETSGSRRRNHVV